MFEKGKAFVMAGLLLDQKDGNPAVVLHLLCQGIENILKAMLLRIDYAHYRPRLKNIGHNLLKCAAAARTASGLHLYLFETQKELAQLDQLYRVHLLRYAGPLDIFVHPGKIPSRRVMRHTGALMMYLESTSYFAQNRV